MAIDLYRSSEATLVQSLEKFLNKRFEEIFTRLDTLERQIERIREDVPEKDDDICSIC